MKKKIKIGGMSCMHCVAHVEEALREINGVNGIQVDLEGQYALVETSIADEVLVEAIEEAGYDVQGVEIA